MDSKRIHELSAQDFSMLMHIYQHEKLEAQRENLRELGGKIEIIFD